MKTVLRGIFLTSEQSAVVARFYRDIAGLPLEEVGEGFSRYWKLDHAGMQLAIHDASKFSAYTHPAEPKSNLTHLYFKIADIPSFLEHLRNSGTDAYCVDEVVVTVVDPDGRKVMFGTA